MANIESRELEYRPIIAYGHDILRKTSVNVDVTNKDKLNDLIKTLWATLNYSKGVGLAAPQINSSDKVFVVNTKLMYNELDNEQRKIMFSGDKGIEETFINASIIDKSEKTWKESEGCLSIPGINENVERPWDITVEYRDVNMELNRKQFSGYTAKVIQHELDHTNGVLFIDHLSILTKKFLRYKLKRVIDGENKTDYPIQYIK